MPVLFQHLPACDAQHSSDVEADKSKSANAKNTDSKDLSASEGESEDMARGRSVETLESDLSAFKRPIEASPARFESTFPSLSPNSNHRLEGLEAPLARLMR